MTIERGEWRPANFRSAVNWLVLSGCLVRRLEIAGRHSAELLGQGDLVRPTDTDADTWVMVPSTATWRALERTQLAVLGRRFASWAPQHPAAMNELLARATRRSRTLALRLALAQLPLVSARLHFLLWHLADRFGRVGRDGVTLTVPLTHGLLADLVSSSRPKVSEALGELKRHGLVTRTADRGWVLLGRPPTDVTR